MKKIMIILTIIICLVGCMNQMKDDQKIESNDPIVCIASNNEYLYYITSDEDYVQFVLHQYQINEQESKSLPLKIKELQYVWDIKANEDGCIIFDESIAKQFIFDEQLNLMDAKEIENIEVMEHDFISNQLYSFDDFYTTTIFTDFSKEQEVFTTKKDIAYLINEDIFSICYVYDDYVLCDSFSEEGLHLSLYDYQKQILMNQFMIETSMDVDVIDLSMNDQYLFVMIADYRGEQAKYMIEKIEYLKDPVNKQADIQLLDEAMLKQQNEQIIDHIKDTYDLKIFVDTYEGEKVIKENSVYENLLFGCDELDVYEVLLVLQDYLNSLPQGMVEEMIHGYQVFVDNKNIEIHIVKEIIGDSVAYVSQYDNNLRMYLSTSEFHPSTIPHEWMHLMYYKIEDYMYVNDRDFYSGWDQFNPQNHEYNVNSLYQEEYFINSYMNTNYDEDIAVLFEYLYMDEDYYWMSDKIEAKANYLTDLINEVFESVDEDEVWNQYKKQ